MASSEEKKLVEETVKRETWERPVLRHLAASQAEGGGGCYDDAGGTGGNCGHHLS